jgi:ketosteroid isomerase-like protein
MNAPLLSYACITGAEDLARLDRLREALARFYRAFNTFDLALMERCWAHTSDVVMVNPGGGIARGWPAVRAVYERLFAGTAVCAVELSDYTLHLGTDMFYAVGLELGRFAIDRTSVQLAIRTTRVFRRLDGEWRQVHHHSSIAEAKTLGAYQSALRAAGDPAGSLAVSASYA